MQNYTWFATDQDGNIAIFGARNSRNDHPAVPKLALRGDYDTVLAVWDLARHVSYDDKHVKSLLEQPEDIGSSRPLPARCEDSDPRVIDHYLQTVWNTILLGCSEEQLARIPRDGVIAPTVRGCVLLKNSLAPMLYCEEMPFDLLQHLLRKGSVTKVWANRQIEPAAVGCFCYDLSEDAHTGEPYIRSESPNVPINVEQIPDELSSQVGRVCFSNLSFPDEETIWCRRHLECDDSEDTEQYWSDPNNP